MVLKLVNKKKASRRDLAFDEVTGAKMMGNATVDGGKEMAGCKEFQGCLLKTATERCRSRAGAGSLQHSFPQSLMAHLLSPVGGVFCAKPRLTAMADLCQVECAKYDDYKYGVPNPPPAA